MSYNGVLYKTGKKYYYIGYSIAKIDRLVNHTQGLIATNPTQIPPTEMKLIWWRNYKQREAKR